MSEKAPTAQGVVTEHTNGYVGRLEGKYVILPDGRIINHATGSYIPDDEPIMIFRAKDKLALATIGFYLSRCLNADCQPEHIEAICERYREFRSWSGATCIPD